nr:XdhC/CoxI family protein [Natroniella acetigena]
MVTITESSSIPELIGEKFLINEDDNSIIDFSSKLLAIDDLEKIVNKALEGLSKGEIEKHELELKENRESIEIVVEPYLPQPRLIILGGGHVGQALYNFAKELDFELIIVDDRPYFANWNLFSEAERVICIGFGEFLTKIEVKEADYIIIATRGHKHDYTCLKQVLDSKARYIGMLGSKRKVTSIFDKLQEEGYSQKVLERIKAPIGLDIGSETPEEIAISILAEVIKVRREEEGINNIIGEEAIRFLSDYQGEYECLALATIIKTSGSTPRNTGSKMTILPDGRIFGTVGGGCGEAEVRQKALEVINGRLDSFVHNIDLSNELAAEEGMICGGKMEVFIERLILC